MDHCLFESLSAFIDDPGAGDFNSLALQLFSRQVMCNQAYRRYVAASGIQSENVTSWREIPAAPSVAFKAYDLTCSPIESSSRVFHSSGTTEARASKHYMDRAAVELYDRSLTRGFEDAIPGASGQPLWAMMPSPNEAPHSSLSHMLATLGASRWFWDDWSSLAGALAEAREPVTLFGTGFAFVALFDNYPDARWPLPPGSLVVNTGGFKGRTREVAQDEFYAMLRERFTIDDKGCLGEYGMSEMASQFYNQGEVGPYKGPHWTRTRIIDPETGADAAEGTAGLLRHYDLANWNSVLAIQTQDLAIAEGDGFHLLGRAPDAEVRGCSLTVEALWNRP
ncbi:MAG: hypothetical protein P4L33_20760 [Capsulimonadaceae bacterium]|nr:hypothetical protein [Capsulimonadaceae bacterium]